MRISCKPSVSCQKAKHGPTASQVQQKAHGGQESPQSGRPECFQTSFDNHENVILQVELQTQTLAPCWRNSEASGDGARERRTHRILICTRNANRAKPVQRRLWGGRTFARIKVLLSAGNYREGDTCKSRTGCCDRSLRFEVPRRLSSPASPAAHRRSAASSAKRDFPA